MENESGNKLEMRIVIGFLFLVAGLKRVGTIIPDFEKIETACYGSDPICDFYSLKCNSSARILLGTLQYGSKNDSVCRDNVQLPNKPGHCNYTENCCTYQTGDCAMDFTMEDTYKAYYNCSGKDMCISIQSPWTLLRNCSDSTSSYVKLQYNCIEDSSIIQLNEESSVTLNSSSSFVQFDARRNVSISSTSRNCSCEIVGVGNDSNTVTVEIKDVRLSRILSVNNVTNCSSARLFIGDSFQESCNSNASHNYVNFVNGKRFYFNVTSNSTLKIRLEDLFLDGEEDIPAMVWLYIEALSPIDIKCNPQPLSPPTTIAPTVTTSTTDTTPDVTATEAVGENESSISTQTSLGTTWYSSDTTLLSTTTGVMTNHTNVNGNITTLYTTISSPATYTLIATTNKDLNTTSGTTSRTIEGQTSAINPTQAGNVSQAWVYTGIGIGVGILILLVLGGLIIYINRSLAHSYELGGTTNGYLLKNKSATRMTYMESSDF
ncbi:hypothetical protein CHS0354_025943 [Potamilus streckersoni]|uniref:Uncharacterized protein n=1 Tax=Potamilus streckersoni TaxID=2493646 RepID=A0AAE0T3X5_9BIVA|nr:hypothetical protein CHS0354_025943 [Potamilus streckersoni]